MIDSVWGSSAPEGCVHWGSWGVAWNSRPGSLPSHESGEGPGRREKPERRRAFCAKKEESMMSMAQLLLRACLGSLYAVSRQCPGSVQARASFGRSLLATTLQKRCCSILGIVVYGGEDEQLRPLNISFLPSFMDKGPKDEASPSWGKILRSRGLASCLPSLWNPLLIAIRHPEKRWPNT